MRKRADGEGSVYFNEAKKRWIAVLVINGKRVERTAKTEKLALAIWRKLHQQRDADRPIPADQQTVAQFLESWLAVAKTHKAPSTYARQTSLLQHNTEMIAGIRLSRLTNQDIQRLYRDRLDAGLAPSTVALLHRVLHAAFAQAVAWDTLTTNPANGARPPRPPRRTMTTLSAEEARRFLDVARGHRWEALFTLALTTGMREGELLALRWSAVNLDAGALQVVAGMSFIAGVAVFAAPKTATGRRRISLSETAVAALRAHKVRQAEQRLQTPGWQDLDLVFCTATGGPVRKDAVVRRGLYPLLAVHGLPRVRFHDLRHTAATLLLEQGVHPKIVSEMLGHTTISMTLDLYSHASKGMHDEAAHTMDALFQPPNPPINGRVNGR